MSRKYLYVFDCKKLFSSIWFGQFYYNNVSLYGFFNQRFISKWLGFVTFLWIVRFCVSVVNQAKSNFWLLSPNHTSNTRGPLLGLRFLIEHDWTQRIHEKFLLKTRLCAEWRIWTLGEFVVACCPATVRQKNANHTPQI